MPRNKAAASWALRTADRWVEQQLLAANGARVRAAAALLLVALVPSQHFRAGYARARPLHAKLPDQAHHTLHQVSLQIQTIAPNYQRGFVDHVAGGFSAQSAHSSETARAKPLLADQSHHMLRSAESLKDI